MSFGSFCVPRTIPYLREWMDVMDMVGRNEGELGDFSWHVPLSCVKQTTLGNYYREQELNSVLEQVVICLLLEASWGYSTTSGPLLATPATVQLTLPNEGRPTAERQSGSKGWCTVSMSLHSISDQIRGWVRWHCLENEIPAGTVFGLCVDRLVGWRGGRGVAGSFWVSRLWGGVGDPENDVYGNRKAEGWWGPVGWSPELLY